jgi:acyl-lipid omega-6 desaturase (Delta-12 desaturase)
LSGSEALRFPTPEELPLAMLRRFQNPVLASSVWQVTTTFGLFVACIAAMYALAHVSVWLVLALSVPTSGLMVRIFVLQHDCGHNALFKSRRANVFVGGLCSLVTLTPFAYFRRTHAMHHGNWNNLDGRGNPTDFYSDCLTVAEFEAMTKWQQFLYRVSHHPLVANILLPPITFLLVFRIPYEMPAKYRRERRSVYVLDVLLLAIFAPLVMMFGVKTVLLVHLPALVIATIVGMWLFAVQHTFDGAHWIAKEEWNFAGAALHGTSYLRLHPVLQWFSGNIGLHHVHHLNPSIPNYRLQAAHDACGELTNIATELSWKQIFSASRYTLWDEASQRMVKLPN